ncbi:MAG: hypothetical protein ACR2NO_11410 [Chloroflexota bacterium]
MTQNDTKRHMFLRVTALSIEQENAINLLLTGASDQSVASRLKLGRSTVHRWRHYHPLFIAELRRRRVAGRESSVDSVRSLVPRALDTVRDQIVNGDGHLSLAFLHKAGIFGTRETGPLLFADVGPTDLHGVVDEEVRRRRASGRLPMPAAAPSAAPTNASANGAASAAGVPAAPAPEPPITDDEREAVLADLLAEASSDAPIDLPFDTPASTTPVAAVAAEHPPASPPVGHPGGAAVVTSHSMASLS